THLLSPAQEIVATRSNKQSVFNEPSLKASASLPLESQSMLRALLSTLSIIAMIHPSLACTAVDIVAADKTVIAGRTMEWAYDMKWTLVSQPKGTKITLTAPPSLKLPAATVATKYAVVGVSAGIIP